MLIGTKVKELRKARKMKLIDLAAQTGIQIATLSRIEHEKMTGTLPSHIKIAEALGIELTDLYQDIVQSNKAEPEAKTGRADTETFTFNEKASYEILTNNVMTKKMMPIIMRIESKGRTSQEHGTPGSERFIFILKGKITAHIGDKTFTLKTNNSLYFDASVQHYFENAGDSEVKFVSVITPVTL